MDVVFETVGKVIAVGGSSVFIAYSVFHFLGKNWLENKFKESLEAYKHEQRKEIERLRLEINTQFNRTTKIHEKEIEILPIAWKKLRSSIDAIEYFTIPLRAIPNFNAMTEAELEEYLEGTVFRDSEKKRLRESKDIFKDHQEIAFWHDLHNTKSEFRQFHLYIKENSIFMQSDLKHKFEEIDNTMWSAINNKEHGFEIKDLKLQTSGYRTIRDEILPLVKEIEDLVQHRLRFDIVE